MESFHVSSVFESLDVKVNRLTLKMYCRIESQLVVLERAAWCSKSRQTAKGLVACDTSIVLTHSNAAIMKMLSMPLVKSRPGWVMIREMVDPIATEQM